MKDISPLDEAQLTHEMRTMYQQIGFEASMQVLYELLKSAEILSEVMLDERRKEN